MEPVLECTFKRSDRPIRVGASQGFALCGRQSVIAHAERYTAAKESRRFVRLFVPTGLNFLILVDDGGGSSMVAALELERTESPVCATDSPAMVGDQDVLVVNGDEPLDCLVL